jgi:hypothetical protein
MKITTYEYEKVPVKDTEIFIPNEPFYCFQTGVRRSIRIIPKIITWNSPDLAIGEVYELEVTCVYQSSECVAEKFNLRVSFIEDYINNNEKGLPGEISRMLLNEDYYIRTEEQFNTDLDSVISSLKSIK